MGMALMLITHDLGLVANRADHLVVMYAGRAVEQGRVAEVFSRPAHPYTRGLLGSQPRLGGGRDRLDAIAGTVPSLTRLPAGCRFRDRCRLAEAACADDTPGLSAVGTEHWAACPVTVKGECG
jgi:oligopeptide/dipeptide ABC transporter ATP-binding protein